MHRTLLPAAIAIALAATPSCPAGTFPSSTGALDVRYMRMSDLPAVLISTQGDPHAWKTPSALRGMSLAVANASPDPVIAWVPASALADAGAREEAMDIVSTGTALLVTARPTEARYETNLFGVQAQESTVLYQPLEDGTVHMHLFEESTDPGARAAIAQGVLDAARRRVAPSGASTTHARSTRRPRSLDGATRMEDAPTVSSGVRQPPRKLWGASKSHANGSTISVLATVTRDVSRTHDSKLITVKTDAEVIPYQNGLGTLRGLAIDTSKTWPWELLSAPPPGLVVPGEYGLSTWLRWPENATPGARTLEHHPLSDGSTDRTIADRHVTQTSWNASVSPEVSGGLADAKLSPEGKIAASVSYSETTIDEHSVTMTLKDYSTAFALHDDIDGQIEAAWRFPLADDIAARADWFGKPADTARRTPMMKQAGLQAAVTWRVDGDYDGLLSVSSAATVSNRYFHGWSRTVDGARDCDTRIAVEGSVACTVSIAGSRNDDAGNRGFVATAQPIVTIEMDLGTPFLTRTPTVLLQSLGQPDRCLAQAPLPSTDIVLRPCDRAEGNRAQHWNLDEASRYVNRASGLCMDMAPEDGTVRAAVCSQASTQRWEWRHDRIHSAFDGGRRRLHASAAGLSTAFRPGADALLPVNATNALLPPWTGYPLKPRRGDYIPGFNVKAEPIPASYLTFDDVDSAQRWEALPLIFGIR